MTIRVGWQLRADWEECSFSPTLTGLGNVTTVADTVTWAAIAKTDDVPNVDIETFQMQITLGCLFNDSVGVAPCSLGCNVV
jgi:hypothetical protein